MEPTHNIPKFRSLSPLFHFENKQNMYMTLS